MGPGSGAGLTFSFRHPTSYLLCLTLILPAFSYLFGQLWQLAEARGGAFSPTEQMLSAQVDADFAASQNGPRHFGALM